MSKGVPGDEVASVVLDRTQQPTKILRLKDRCIVLCLGRDQRPAEHRRRVAFAARRGNPIAKHAARKGSGLFGGLVLALRFEALEGSQHLERLNLVDRTAADGIRQLVEEEVGLDDGRIRPAVLHHHLIDVLARHRLECLG
jgi:hypothetical protein